MVGFVECSLCRFREECLGKLIYATVARLEIKDEAAGVTGKERRGLKAVQGYRQARKTRARSFDGFDPISLLPACNEKWWA